MEYHRRTSFITGFVLFMVIKAISANYCLRHLGHTCLSYQHSMDEGNHDPGEMFKGQYVCKDFVSKPTTSVCSCNSVFRGDCLIDIAKEKIQWHHSTIKPTFNIATLTLKNPTSQPTTHTHLISSSNSQQNSQPFQSLPLTVYLQDPDFLRCDSFIRKGQYRSLITRSPHPYHSVSTRIISHHKQYKISYEGAGGGILFCLLEISLHRYNSTIILISILDISSDRVVPNCQDYNPQKICQCCQPHYHLEKGICYPDIIGCQQYYGPICLSCEGYAVLVENRCLTHCGQLCDLNKVKFIGNSLR